MALQQQAQDAATLNQTAASNLPKWLNQNRTLAAAALLPEQQAWHLHKGLQLLQEARDEGIIPGEDAERLGDDFKSSLAQDQANLLLATAPHAIAQALQQRFRSVLTGQEDAEGAQLGKLISLAGVRRYPGRIKCALLGWHALMHALDGKP